MCHEGVSVFPCVAQQHSKKPYAKQSRRTFLPRVVATVVALDRRGLFTIQAKDGTTSQVVSGTKWRVGDTVTCERSDKPNVPLWKAFDCRKD